MARYLLIRLADAIPTIFLVLTLVFIAMRILPGDPALAALDAVVNQRFLVIPFAAGVAGVRSVPATVDLAAQLKAL